ncbi:MAG: aminomethyltransferase [Saprospiraceae bacterium]|jgi:aminomethyltransferase
MSIALELKRSNEILTPGLFGTDLGSERHRVEGGGAVALPIYAGDFIEIVDKQGRQSVCVAGFDSLGAARTAELGLQPNAKGDLIQACFLNGGTGADRLEAKLKAVNIDLPNSPVAHLLTDETPAGSSVTFTAETDLLTIICAPGAPMSFAGTGIDLPATEVIVYIRRANIQQAADFALPDPLADPMDEIRVHASTAVAYEVKQGDYIQIQDVAGRQCSDFQCFSAEKLDQGIERSLDATATRSMMGSVYPGPGLNSKFYDTDLEPLIQVVQDTCGRHDSFGVACTSKYYDEAGYPGHVNCSDNFNRVLDPYPVGKRKGWMAMNLFFNTFFDDNFQLLFDDPWSRPGDFVLMKALKDLVCLTSACPCDIDAANGWVPTDIHVRTYSKTNLFKQAIAYRKTTDAPPVMTQETGFHARTSLHTRNFVEYNGYWLANNFTKYGALEEYWACRKGVVMTDLSPLRKYEVVGPDAELLMQTCVTRDIRKLAVGQVVYTGICYPNGGMIDDGTVFRIGKDNFRWIGGCESSGDWIRTQATELGLRAWVKNSTPDMCNLQVQGPKSLDTLRDIIWTREDQARIDELGCFKFSIARVGGELGIPILVSRTGYTGEQGYEIFCHPSDGPAVWDAVWEAGQPFDVKPLGLEALDMLRIEAGLIFAGYEFCDQTDPFEAGIGFTVPLKTKEDDFIGKDALIKRKATPQRKLVGLELNGGEIAGNGDGVFVGRNQVGQITSGVMSPILGKNIALCRMSVGYTKPGTKVEVGKLDGHQKRIPAEVTKFPHFDPTKERVRGNYE